MNYPSIRIEGAILTPDVIDTLENQRGQQPADFGFAPGSRVKDEIARAWADAQDYWRIFRRRLDALPAHAPATSETRSLWIAPLLGLLRYDLEFQKSAVQINGKSYAVSHRAVNRAGAPVHVVGFRDEAGLDRKPAHAALRMSAHAVVQEFLNLTEQLYGIVTNGRTLRLLRDNSRLVRLSFIEFDLERIFTDGLFADFAVLFRLLHASRLPAADGSAAECTLERLHQDSLDSGARIRDRLSQAVEDAILAFGDGFLAHPANQPLRDAVRSGALDAAEFYKALLRLIYRLLFLMVIEERGLVFPASAQARHRDAYARFYSVQRLRTLSEKRGRADARQSDLWLALRSTFRLFEADGPGALLGLQPLAGDLFRPDLFSAAALSNDVLLRCLRALDVYTDDRTKQIVRVNYAALNVEEFGSVYEGLLEYAPVFDASDPAAPRFGFRRGDDRAATGSHYTPDDLVQPLIRHSLDHLIAERLAAPRPEAALLDLRVADIACGSGHILLAAARRIAAALAAARTGEEQPSPTAYRAALRDVIRTCIYGVDLNPLAVELCKVALWLEAHVPGEPLNFLDHRIKCGNAIVGAVRREEIDAGVPDEAFAKLPGDDSEVARAIRARNKAERKKRGFDQLTMDYTSARRAALDDAAPTQRALSALPERTPAEIDAKKRAFEDYEQGEGMRALKQIASIPIAQFYQPRTTANQGRLITDAEFRRYWRGDAAPDDAAAEAAFALAARKRFFHWFLEFPEITARGGFDCILGNPPYLGGQALSGTYGHEFCNYVRAAYAPTGLSDLVVYFLRRIFALLKPGGFTAFITTNSIKDGDVRKDGLEQVIAGGGVITMAVRAVKWPGRANLVVSLLAIHHGPWRRPAVLDGQEVAQINAFFEDGADAGEPQDLAENAGRVFQGSIFLGDGFLLTHEQAEQLRIANPRNDEVLFKVINGQELNNAPDQRPGRSIINFRDWSIERAEHFTAPFDRIRELVKPIRDRDNMKSRREKWWIYGATASSLYAGIGSLTHCFATARITKHFNFSRVPTDIVFTDTAYVLTTDRWDIYAVVQSTIHEVWARKYSGALKQDLRYSPSKCFETFAFPGGLWGAANPALAEVGARYHEHRRGLMLRLWLGLTDVYNLFHAPELAGDLAGHYAARAKKDPRGLAIPAEHRDAALSFTLDEAHAGVLALRQLHAELDAAVLAAYGWGDLPLGHGFHEIETLPENDRVRCTISAAARRELLARLLRLNHARAAAAADVAPKAKAKRSAKAASTEMLPGLE